MGPIETASPPSDRDTAPGLPAVATGEADLWLAAISASSRDAICGTDVNRIVTSWNHAAEVMFGFTAAEIVGRPIGAIIPSDRMDEEIAVLD